MHCISEGDRETSMSKRPVTVEEFIRLQYADTYGHGGTYETKRTGNAVAAWIEKKGVDRSLSER